MQVFLRKNGLLLIAVCTVLYFPIFWQLDKLPLSIWDEARVGVNALEIDGFKKTVAPYYEGKPDMWSLKPPLLPVLQRICMEIAGYDVTAVRLPSALATLGICLLFMGFGYLKYGTLWPGIFAALALTTSPGFIRDHIARTGDYDALLSFFMAAYVLAYFLYLESGRKKHLYLAGAALILGVLTKGVAALIPLPGLLIYTLLARQGASLFRTRALYILVGLFVLVAGAVYGLREYYTPGYLELVFRGELITVPTEPIAGHEGPWWFYVDSILLAGFTYFTACMLLGIISGFTGPLKDRVFPFLAAYLGGYLVIISAAATKTYWYEAPFYPIAALAAGIFIYKALHHFSSQMTPARSMAFMCLSAIVIFAAPYQSMVKFHWNVVSADWDLVKYEDYMKKFRREKPELDTYTVLGQSYNPHSLFFAEAFAKDGMAVQHKNIRDTLMPGEIILSCERAANDHLKKTYSFDVIDNSYPCVIVQIQGPADSLRKAPF